MLQLLQEKVLGNLSDLVVWDPLQPVTSPGPGATAAIRYCLSLNNFSRVKGKLQQELGPTVSYERFQQIFPRSFTPEPPPSALDCGSNPLPWAFVFWSSLSHGAKDPRNLPSLPLSQPPHPSRLRERFPWHRQLQKWDQVTVLWGLMFIG